MVSDSDLVARLREILQSSDLNTTTPGTVRRQLENDFGVDLSDRKRFIGQQIDEFLESHVKNEEGDDDAEEAEEEKEEEEEEGLGVVEEGEDDDEESDKLVHKKRSRNKRSTDDEVTPKKKKGGGFTKVCSLSPQLHEFLGTSELARTEVVKRLWAYIRENELQDPKNKRIIRCDDKFRPIFNVERIDMFQMNKALSKHIWPLEAEVSSASTSAMEKRNKQGNEDEDKPKMKPKKQKRGDSDEDEPKVKPKKQKGGNADEDEPKMKPKKGGNSGLAAPIPLSEALINFLGTGETQLSRSDVVKRMWDYFKKNELQDPSDKRMILCDDKLKELLDVDSFRGFSISKLLSSHFIKAE